MNNLTRGKRDIVFLIFSFVAIFFISLSILEWGAGHSEAERVKTEIPSEVEMLGALEEAAEASVFFQFIIYSFSLLIFLGFAIDIQFLWGLIRRGGAGGVAVKAIDWGLLDVVRVVLVFLIALFGFQAIYPILKYLSADASEISFAIVFQFLSELIALVFLLQLIPLGWGRSLRQLGFTAGHVWGHIFTGLKSYIGFLPVLLLLNWITEMLASWWGIELKPQEQIGFFFMDLSLPALVFLVCFMVFIGPVFEEIFFRGFAYQALRRRAGRWPCILLTALLFSALHASFSVFLPIMGLGVLLAYVFEKSGSLVPAITIHICQNGLGVAAVLLIRYLS